MLRVSASVGNDVLLVVRLLRLMTCVEESALMNRALQRWLATDVRLVTPLRI